VMASSNSCATAPLVSASARHPSNAVAQENRALPMSRVLRLRRPAWGAPVNRNRHEGRLLTAARRYAAANVLKAPFTFEVVENMPRPPHRSMCHRCEKPLRVVRPAHRLGDCAGRSPGSRVSA
jgi:hypothetical protein